MNQSERAVLEAVEQMLTTDLGLSGHAKAHKETGKNERGSEYVHNDIDDAFAMEVADLDHYETVTSIFARLHAHMYLNDLAFTSRFVDQARNAGVPPEDVKKALAAVSKIAKKYDEEPLLIGSMSAEQAAGYHSELSDLKAAYGDIQDQYPGRD